MLNSRINLLTALASALLVCTITHAQPAPPPPPQAELLAVLKSDSATLEAKVAACRQLGQVGSADAIPVLASLLGDEKLAHMARYGLEQIPGPAVDEALRSALPKLHGMPQVGVLQSLGVRRDARAVEAIASLLKDNDADVASAAAYALGRIGSADAGKALAAALTGSSESLRPALWDAALTCGDLLRRENHATDAAALFEPLRTWTTAPIHIRMAAARGVVLARGPAGLELLTALLQDPELWMFNAALRLAIEIPGDAATATFAAQVEKLPPARAALLLRALANRGDKSALPAIRAAVQRSDAAIRVAALAAIAKFADAASLNTALEAATAADKPVADAAATAIVRLPGADVDAALLEWVGGSDAARSVIAIECLARRHNAAAAPALLKAATGAAEANVRLAALQALGDLGGINELAALAALLSQAKSPEERTVAEQSLGAICSVAADRDPYADKLIAALPAATPEAQMALLRVLAVVGGAKALGAERAAIKDANPDVQDTAIHALCDWSNAEAAADLLDLAKTAAQEKYKILAIRGYLRLAGDSDLPTTKRLEMCNAALPLLKRNDEKRLLLGTLGRINSADTLPLIVQHLENPAVREEACVAAVGIAGRITNAAEDLGPATAVIIDAMEKVAKATKSGGTRATAQRIAQQLRKP